MPRRRKRAARTNNGVVDFRHAEARRKNNPPAGIAPTYEVRERQARQYAYDPHLDPQLVWAGKAEHASFEVDVVSLHIHERIIEHYWRGGKTIPSNARLAHRFCSRQRGGG